VEEYSRGNKNEMTSFGEHDAYVREIMDFVKSGGLLSSRRALSERDQYTVETDLSAALHAAHTQFDEPTRREDWTDLRERQASRILAAIYQRPDADSLLATLDDLSDLLTQQIIVLMKRKHTEIVDDIIGDIGHCVSSRAIWGLTDRFFEMLWLAYASGGWPCGWDGIYPIGQMIVFRP